MFDELEGKSQVDVVPNASESRSGIWDRAVKHNYDAEWLKELSEELKDGPQQENISIEVEGVMQMLKKMPMLKISGPDGLQGYWLKNVERLHEIITV